MNLLSWIAMMGWRECHWGAINAAIAESPAAFAASDWPILYATADHADRASRRSAHGFSLANRIDNDLQKLMLVDATPVGEPALDHVLALIAAEPNAELSVRDWIDRLAPEADRIRELSLKRLIERGILREEEGRFLWVFQTRRYPIIDNKEQTEVKLRIAQILMTDEIPDPRDIAILNLADACGLLYEVFSSHELSRLEERIEQVTRMDLIGQATPPRSTSCARPWSRSCRAEAMTFLLSLHALAAVLWVGGMFFAYMILRPAAGSLEAPAPALARVFAHFFPWVWASVLLLLASGYTMLFASLGGFREVGVHVHLMQATGLFMMLLFAYLFFAPWRHFQQAVDSKDWTQAGRHLGSIRRVVAINLLLGLLTVVVGSGGRYW